MANDAQAPAQPGWQFTPEDPAAHNSGAHLPLNWTASEYIAHNKASGWYLGLGLVTVVAAGLMYLLTKDFISVGVILFIGVIFGVSAARKPKVLQYAISDHGIAIGSKLYPYGMFKSFSLVQEGPIESIYLMPLKRFMPAITVYFPPEQVEPIYNALGSFLPQEERQQDAVDRLMHRIRF